MRLGEAWPRALPVAELGDDEAVRDALLRAYTANLVQLHVWAPALPAAAPERPVASALARAAGGARDARHERCCTPASTSPTTSGGG